MLLSATKNRKAQGALLLLALASVFSILLVSAVPAHATGPSLYQSKKCDVSGGSTTVTCAFTSSVTSGDWLVAMWAYYGSGGSVATVSSVSGTQSGAWAVNVQLAPSSSNYGCSNDNSGCSIGIASSYATSSGSDTVSLVASNTLDASYVTMYEFNGIGTGETLITSSGTGASSPATVSSFSPATGQPVVAMIMDSTTLTSGWTAAGSFSTAIGPYCPNSCARVIVGYDEYDASYGGGASTLSTTVPNGSTPGWAMVAVGFSGNVVQPIRVSMANSASAATVTITGAPCNSNSSTFQSDSSTDHFLIVYGCSFTVGFTNSGSTRDGFSVSSAFAAASSTESGSATLLSLTAYEQVSESFAYSITGGGAGYSAPFMTGTYLGASGTAQGPLTTTPVAYWLDYSTGWSAPATLSGSGSTEQWVAASYSGTSSAGSSVTVAYQNQYASTGLTVNGCNGEYVSPSTTGWWNAGTVSVTCNGVWSRSGGTGVRAISYNWNSGSNTAVLTVNAFTESIAISASETLNVNPTTQYFVTLDSGATAALSSCNPTIPGDGCWYDSGTTASITLNGVFNRASGSGARLEDWQLDSGSVNGLTTTAQTTVQIPTITAPHTIYSTTVTQYQVTPSAGLILSRPTIANDTGWYDANAQVTITGEGGAATYVVSTPLWANQVSSYGLQLVTNAAAGSINYGSLDLVYTCSSCWTRLFVPTASGLSVQTVTQGGVSLSYSTQGFITSFSATGGSSAWEIYFGQVGSGGLPPATTTSTTTSTSSTSSDAPGGLFSNPSTTSYLEIAGLVAVLVAAVAVLMLKDKQARNIVIKIRNKVG